MTISAPLLDGRLRPSSPIHLDATDATVTSVTVAAGTATVPGTLTGAVWTPTHPLKLNTTYHVVATATDTHGAPVGSAQDFTTIDPTHTVAVAGVTPSTGSAVGDAQPVAVSFTAPVQDRAAVQKALSITDTRHVAGAWHWISDRRIDYRPQTYWPVGDSVSMTANLEGVQTGAHQWGSGTITSTLHVTSDVKVVVDSAAHELTVYRGGKVVRTLPAGTGMPGFETWTGSMVVLEKADHLRMTSCSVGLGCDKKSTTFYDLVVDDDIRLTPSGTFIHAAPWDGSIGRANTSHGCIHLRPADAAWLLGQVDEGTLVTVKGPGQQVALGNGEGDWNLSWEQWRA